MIDGHRDYLKGERCDLAVVPPGTQTTGRIRKMAGHYLGAPEFTLIIRVTAWNHNSRGPFNRTYTADDAFERFTSRTQEPRTACDGLGQEGLKVPIGGRLDSVA